VPAGRHPGEHPFHHDLRQQVIVTERGVGGELDLVARNGAAPWPLDRHASAAQHGRPGRAPMPVSLPLRELGVLRAADLGGHLRGHHLAHHGQADRGAHR